MYKNRFAVFTLANNKQPVVISLNNIAFAMRIQDNDKSGKNVEYTRVFLKELIIDDNSKWVDILESPTQFKHL